MTHDETTEAVRASLLAEDGRATRHGVYPSRTAQRPSQAPQTGRGEAVPGAALALAVARVESMRAQYRVREHGAWS